MHKQVYSKKKSKSSNYTSQLNLPKLTTSNTLADLSSEMVQQNSPLGLMERSCMLPKMYNNY